MINSVRINTGTLISLLVIAATALKTAGFEVESRILQGWADRRRVPCERSDREMEQAICATIERHSDENTAGTTCLDGLILTLAAMQNGKPGRDTQIKLTAVYNDSAQPQHRRIFAVVGLVYSYQPIDVDEAAQNIGCTRKEFCDIMNLVNNISTCQREQCEM